MALLDFQQRILAYNKLWGATVGTADLPTSAGIGDWTVGDIVLNLAATPGAPAMWQVSAVGSTGTPTFQIIATSGTANAFRTVAGSTTLLASDHYLFISAAGTVTLPAPSAALGVHSYTIKATAQPVTLTAASGSLDGVATGSITISTQDSIDLFTDATNWYSISNYSLIGGPVRAITAPGTVFPTDRWVTSGAGQLTLAPTAGWAIGQPVGINATASSVTITPTSGNINGGAAWTLAANARAQVLTDGTNFFVY